MKPFCTKQLLSKFMICLTSFMVLTFYAETSFAKREEPKAIKPILHGGYTYTLVTSKHRNKLGNIEFVCKLEALFNNKIVNKKIVYSYTLNSDLEEDVQEIYPTKFTYEPSKLPPYAPKWFNVEREDGKSYKVTLDKKVNF